MDMSAVYSREIEDLVLTLEASGWTYKRTFVLVDRETETLWLPDNSDLQGIQGRFVKRKLPGIPSERTTWGRWVEMHPDTKLIP